MKRTDLQDVKVELTYWARATRVADAAGTAHRVLGSSPNLVFHEIMAICEFWCSPGEKLLGQSALIQSLSRRF